VDIAKECTRLIKGFSETVDNFEAINQLQQLKKYVKIPSWQKSTFWKVHIIMFTNLILTTVANAFKTILQQQNLKDEK
jgi:hypothetical protein